MEWGDDSATKFEIPGRYPSARARTRAWKSGIKEPWRFRADFRRDAARTRAGKGSPDGKTSGKFRESCQSSSPGRRSGRDESFQLRGVLSRAIRSSLYYS